MKKHLDAAYSEIGKLSVKLIEANLGIDQMTSRNNEDEERGSGHHDKVDVMRSYRTPDD